MPLNVQTACIIKLRLAYLALGQSLACARGDSTVPDAPALQVFAKRAAAVTGVCAGLYWAGLINLAHPPMWLGYIALLIATSYGLRGDGPDAA